MKLFFLPLVFCFFLLVGCTNPNDISPPTGEFVSGEDLAADPNLKDLAHGLDGFPFIVFKVRGLGGSFWTDVWVERPLLERDIGIPHDDCEGVFHVMNLGSGAKDIVFLAAGYLPGEKVSIVVQTRKGGWIGKSFTVCAAVIPSPIEHRNKNGTLMRATLQGINPDCYSLESEGLPEEGELHVLSFARGNDAGMENIVKYYKDRPLQFFPRDINQKSGVTDMYIQAPGGELFALTLPWGDALLNFLDRSLCKKVKERLPDEDNFQEVVDMIKTNREVLEKSQVEKCQEARVNIEGSASD